MIDTSKLSLSEIIERIDPAAIDILKDNLIVHNKAEMSRFLQHQKIFHVQIAETIRDNPKANTVGKAFNIVMCREPLIPEPAKETAGEKFIRAVDKADGTIKYAERILRQEIDIERQWHEETQTDFRGQLINMRDNLQKMIDQFDKAQNNS